MIIIYLEIILKNLKSLKKSRGSMINMDIKKGSTDKKG
jgi:hypothetical protein